MVRTSKIFLEKIVIAIVGAIVGGILSACVIFYTGAKNSQTESLKNEALFWKERSNQLKDNLDKMKAETDKLAELCSDEKLQASEVKNIKKNIDGIYRKTIPMSHKIELEKF